jgi:hypothetical protein
MTRPILCVDDLCTEQRITSIRYVRSEVHPISHTPVRRPPLKLLAAARPSIDKPLGRTTLAPRRSWSARAVSVF